VGYLLWSDFSKESNDPLTWDICQELYDRRGYKPKHLRENSDDKYLDHKAIASYTYIAYDKVRTCFTVFLKYWGGSCWRKIAEVHLNDKWRVFADCDPIYGHKDVLLKDVKAVMALPDKAFSQDTDGLAHISNLGQWRLNQLLPTFIYNKKCKTYINNKHLPFKNGQLITYDTNYSYPKWFIVAPHVWSRGSRNTQLKETERNRIQLDKDINLYVRQFVRKTFRRKEELPSDARISLLSFGEPSDFDIYPSVECDWMTMLTTQGLGEEKQDRHRPVVPWGYFNRERADIKLYQMFTRAISIDNDLDEIQIVRALESQSLSKKDKKFWVYCWPVYLLYLAICKETIWPQAYIKKFLYDHQHSGNQTKTYNSVYSCESITRVLLKKYLKRFYSKFLLLRCTDMGRELTETFGNSNRQYGAGAMVPEGLQDLTIHRRY
jgi:hypothetical protein